MAESEKLESLASEKEDKWANSSLSSSIQNPTTGYDDITKCVICHETLKEPRSLPCLHVFCLSCLKKYQKDNTSAGDIYCPKCKEIFKKLVPSGIDSLPTDDFISNLIKSKEGTGKESEKEEVDKAHFCDVCLDIDKSTQNATWFCNQCAKMLCNRCRAVHESMLNKSNGHAVVPQEQKATPAESMKRRPSYCEKHNNLIAYYCCECEFLMCAESCLPEHKHSNTKHITDASDESILSIEKLNGLLPKSDKSGMDSVLEQLKKTSADFDQQVKETEDSIKHKLAELSRKMKSELQEKEDRHKKDLVKLKEDIEDFQQKLKSFEKYFSFLKDEGSPVDVLKNNKRLHAYAKKLLAQKLENDWKSRKEYYTIRMSEATSELFQTPVLSGTIDEKVGPLQDIGILLRNAKGVLMVSGGNNIHGMTIYGEKLYVVKSKSPIMEEYDLSDLTNPCKRIQVQDLNNPRGIVACPKKQCLYISNTKKPNYIYKVNMDNGITSEDRCEVPKKGWDVEDGKPRGLSVSNRHNLLASIRPKDGGLIIEYDAVGHVIRKILVNNISSLQHAIELNETGQLLVCYHDPDNCVSLIHVKVDDLGMITPIIRKTFATGEGTSGGSLKYPHHLMVDVLGNILLSDCWNDKLRVFTPNLELLGDIKPVGVDIWQPTAFCWDAVRGKLIVGEDRGNIITIHAGNLSEAPTQVCQSD